MTNFEQLEEFVAEHAEVTTGLQKKVQAQSLWIQRLHLRDQKHTAFVEEHRDLNAKLDKIMSMLEHNSRALEHSSRAINVLDLIVRELEERIG